MRESERVDPHGCLEPSSGRGRGTGPVSNASTPTTPTPGRVVTTRWGNSCRMDRAPGLHGAVRSGRGDQPGMGRPPVRVGVVDIGTNSMRLLVTDGTGEAADGSRSPVSAVGSIDRHLPRMESGIPRPNWLASGRRWRRRRSANGLRSPLRPPGTPQPGEILRPGRVGPGGESEMITGEEEARLAFTGATNQVDVASPRRVDIGGGSTEFVTPEERCPSTSARFASPSARSPRARPTAEMGRPGPRCRDLLGVDLQIGTLIGVAGTWTSLAAIAQDLPEYSRDRVWSPDESDALASRSTRSPRRRWRRRRPLLRSIPSGRR